MVQGRQVISNVQYLKGKHMQRKCQNHLELAVVQLYQAYPNCKKKKSKSKKVKKSKLLNWVNYFPLTKWLWTVRLGMSRSTVAKHFETENRLVVLVQSAWCSSLAAFAWESKLKSKTTNVHQFLSI